MQRQRHAHIFSFLQKEVDNSPLIIFRICFGALMFFEGVGAIATGWAKETFVDPTVTFNFIGLDFLQVMVGPQMYVVYSVIALLGLAIMMGWKYRLAAFLMSIVWGMTYLLQKSHYNNHYYLIWLIMMLLIIVPAHRYRSLDAKRSGSEMTVPYWCIFIFQLQIAIVYFYAAIAKIYPDWLHAKPMGLWFTWKSYETFLWNNGFAATLKEFFRMREVHYFFSYAGIFFDLFIIPAFIWKRTRTIALVASLFFHLLNSAIFQIGIFPYFALSFAVFFYPRETIRRIFLPRKPKFTELPINNSRLILLPKWSLVLLVFFLFQLFLPLRHWRIPGDVLWTEEGHRLSWRMMLRTKSGEARFRVLNVDAGINASIDNRDYLTYNQISRMSWRPDMIWQFAQIIEDDYKERYNVDDVEVYVNAKVGVNGRVRQPFTDPSIDISALKWNRFGHQSWLLPKPF